MKSDNKPLVFYRLERDRSMYVRGMYTTSTIGRLRETLSFMDEVSSYLGILTEQLSLYISDQFSDEEEAILYPSYELF